MVPGIPKRIVFMYLLTVFVLVYFSLFSSVTLSIGNFNNNLKRYVAGSDCEDIAPVFGLQEQSEVNLTLFTTFSNNNDRVTIEKNVIHNWAWLSPKIQCFNMEVDMNSSPLSIESKKYRWQSRKVSKLSIGLPVVKNMFLDVISSTHTDYYGFANSDILFNKDLMPTLEAVHQFHNTRFPNTSFLIVGGRWNIDAKLVGTDVTNTTRLDHLRSGVEHQPPHTVDVFITSKHYPWKDFIDVVVARIVWDNYAMAFAYLNNLVTYTITDTVTALHQSYEGNNSSGHTSANLWYNAMLIRKTYPDLTTLLRKHGFLHQTTYYTKYDKNNEIKIIKRLLPENRTNDHQQKSKS